MNILKKIALVILILSGLLVLAVWSPWQNWNLSLTNLLGIEAKEEFSALKVKSLTGEIDIFIDGEYRDTASPETDLLEIFPIDPGEHTVLLRRRNHEDYEEVVRKINFEPQIDVIVGYEIGPSETFSEGHILYARKSFASPGSPLLEIFSSPEKINVFLDNQFIGETPLKDVNLDISDQRKLRFEKDGYDELEIIVLPESQEERDKLKDTILTIEINLFARPINIVTE
ncbi:MAG: hypothetical protein ACE5DX_01540 [Candidatus Dojkabacteria bacterium]